MVQGVFTDPSVEFFPFEQEIFDRDFYLAANPDVAAAGFRQAVDALQA